MTIADYVRHDSILVAPDEHIAVLVETGARQPHRIYGTITVGHDWLRKKLPVTFIRILLTEGFKPDQVFTTSLIDYFDLHPSEETK